MRALGLGLLLSAVLSLAFLQTSCSFDSYCVNCGLDDASAADAAVHLSTAQGFANSVTEAMACGLPVIASDATSHPEQIAHRKPFEFIEPRPRPALESCGFTVSERAV